MPASTALIVGCGYLGRGLAARLVELGQVVYGTTRSPDKARQLAALGVRPMLVHITQPVTLAALTPAIEAESLDVYHMIPPGRPGQSPSPRQVVLGGIAHVVKALRRANVRRAVLVSSSAVYGQRNGQLVDADTPAKPIDERGRLLLEGEQLWLAAGEAFHVVRLAGLYGPGRVVGLKAVHDGSPLVGNPQAMLNLLHVDDAVALLLAMRDAEQPGRVELGCDGHPVPRVDYYGHLAKLLDVPPPQVLDDATAARMLGLNLDRLRRSSSKALDNIATCRRTGWSPRFASYRDGLDDALSRSRS
ncbi:NAD-dependent epimerase/dehydratase family protein [Phycisphaerales bacterium AB-hyl4]|uniref:NAD-dependent epimerase/dehydratase family protein n=1 Tax=Natronomicrosphaera hydrolytica TaxID=3242702 RepID=A0ABV4U721_9BACT